ncbi:MAG: shikimate dehydrogenase family protein [Christensenellales bacterium]
MNVKYDLNTQVMLLIGDPLGHSVISKVHAAIFEKRNMNAIFFPVEVSAANLGEFMKASKLFKLVGIGVTMPHKTTVGAYCDEVEEVARLFGVTNNIAIDKDGKYNGFATDGYGMCQALENAGMAVKGRSVLILGAGGVAGIVAAELAKRGATELFIANRTVEKAQAIVEKLKQYSPIKATAVSTEPAELDKAAGQCSILFQCTSLGMHGKGAEHEYLGFLDKMPKGSGIAEAIYNPDPTKLISEAKKRGFLTVSGMAMYLCQLKINDEKIFHITLDDDDLKLAEKVMKDAIAGKI